MLFVHILAQNSEFFCLRGGISDYFCLLCAQIYYFFAFYTREFLIFYLFSHYLGFFLPLCVNFDFFLIFSAQIYEILPSTSTNLHFFAFLRAQIYDFPCPQKQMIFHPLFAQIYDFFGVISFILRTNIYHILSNLHKFMKFWPSACKNSGFFWH